MNNTKRIISTLLTVCMLLGSLTGLFAIEAFAEDVVDTVVDNKEEELDLSSINYFKEAYYTADEKLATMEMRLQKGDYQLWVNDYTGEVAVVNVKTGENLMTNPYDVGISKAADSVKAELLSQLIIGYTGNNIVGTNIFTSYTDAALNNQIKIKNIKNGIRVEYTIGREETKYLVPRLITEERFQTQILDPLMAALEASGMSQWRFTYNRFKSFFAVRDPEGLSDRMLADLYKEVPITAELGAVYMIDVDIKPAELQELEEIIKTYCPAYTYEELDMDHTQTRYESQDQNPAVFKLALEYTIDDMGVSVTLPANGIRFDESIYQLSYITILPYMGAGRYSTERPNEGYTFIPDGSGAIFRFEDLADNGATISGKIYGEDYAYHTLSGLKYQETFKMPVYGIVRDNKYNYELSSTNNYKIVESENTNTSGFFAIIEEGDALAELKSYHMGQKGEYHTVQVSVTPRPSDTYNIADSISVGTSSTWTVVSERKYVGNYTIRYVMLTDDEVAAEKGVTDYYPADYVGMAYAYRDYLTSPYSTKTQNSENKEVILERIDSSELKSKIPLYLETFGTVETIEKILSVPVTVMTPLTTFEDVMTIYNDLSQEGVDITNINFKLTGYANGGMNSTVPYGLKWEKAVGGKQGFGELLEFANSINSVSGDENGLEIFPEFDFAYVKNYDSFDGLSLKKHAVKTIDNRYIGKTVYSTTYQPVQPTMPEGGLALSPAYYSRFYNELAENYLNYSTVGDGSDLNISVSTLGTDLNSDFDEDEPYNREDSKEFTVEAFKNLSETYGNVMTSGGNSYTWQYADYILDMPIDSSRYLSASNTIPFVGMVLHGYVQYTGSPINMEGNIQYGLLRAIESGASIYFIVTYDNATILKEDVNLSKYYSVRYDIWAGSYNDEGKFEAGQLVDIYHKLNDITYDLQDKIITNHELLDGQRIPDADELIADAKNEEAARLEAEEKAKLEAEVKFRKELLESRTTALKTAENAFNNASGKVAELESSLADITALIATLESLESDLAKATDEAEIEEINASIKSTTNSILVNYQNIGLSAYNTIENAYLTINDKDRIINEAVNYFVESGIYSKQFIDDCKANIAPAKALCDKIDAIYDVATKTHEAILKVAEGVIVVEEESEEVTVTTDNKNSRYIVDDGTIVAVTYGEVGDDYRTFILNYNYFDVKVEYNGQEYEIGRYDFVIIDHNN